MSRTVYLIVYNSPIFPAHWGLWIPSLNDPMTGKFLEAKGDAANGFNIVFQRNHVLGADTRPKQSLPLAQVSDQYVVDVEGDGSSRSDSTACDTLERVLLSVSAPGASLVSSSSQEPRKRVQIQNCQTWLRAGIEALIREGIVDNSALRTIDCAPKN